MEDRNIFSTTIMGGSNNTSRRRVIWCQDRNDLSNVRDQKKCQSKEKRIGRKELEQRTTSVSCTKKCGSAEVGNGEEHYLCGRPGCTKPYNHLCNCSNAILFGKWPEPDRQEAKVNMCWLRVKISMTSGYLQSYWHSWSLGSMILLTLLQGTQESKNLKK